MGGGYRSDQVYREKGAHAVSGSPASLEERERETVSMLVSQFTPTHTPPLQKIYVGSWYLLGKQRSSSSAAAGGARSARELAARKAEPVPAVSPDVSTPLLRRPPRASQPGSPLPPHVRAFTPRSARRKITARCSRAAAVAS